MPLRHAPYADHGGVFTVGLRPIAMDAWFEGEGDEPPPRKDALLAAGESVWREAEGSRPGQAEALALVEQATGARGDPGSAPLWAASRLVADDLCLMEKRDGAWTLTAASLCSPTFFSAREAVGKSLSGLHGPVPGYEDGLLGRVTRIFDALAPDTIVERRNWTVLNSADLYLADPAPMRAEIAGIGPAAAGEALHLRMERQTLRRLPATGGVLFTIRVWCHPLAALRGRPEQLAAFARAWAEASPDFRAYKKLAPYDALVRAFLAEG